MIPNISYPLLLDGGLSNQLESQGCNLNHQLWTANIILTAPEEIVKAHLAYLNAGAQCIITSSYQLSFPGLKALDINKDVAKELILKSVELARKAIDHFMALHPKANRPLIAASIGPFGAFLTDGSEYHGNYELSDQELFDYHQDKIRLLDSSPADFLACETIPGFQEARILKEIVKQCKKKSWISFSCKDEQHINEGTPIDNCVKLMNENDSIFAIGINCTHPKYISGLIKNIKSVAKNKRIVVYPNHGEVYDAETKTWSKPTEECFSPQIVKEWISLGADIIGGCCRVGPNEIAEIASSF